MDPKKLFQKYYNRLAREGIVKSVLCGLAAGLASRFIAAAVCWFVGFKGFWILIVAFAAAAAAAGFLAYYKKFRPTTRSIARRVDELGLEERLITMTELEGDPSYIAMRQREDAMKSLSCVSTDLLKIAVSVPLIVSLVVAGVCSLGSTTVYALYSTGVMKSGMEMINAANEKDPVVYDVEYIAGENGKILGENVQRVYEGEDALAVMAIPEDGYIFVGWSDGYETAYRVDLEIKGDLEVTALFKEAADVDPDDDEENNPDPDDIPPLPFGGGNGNGPNDPSDEDSTDGNGKWSAGDQVNDGQTDYGSELGDATDAAQGGINNGNGDNGGIIGDYFDGIQK